MARHPGTLVERWLRHLITLIVFSTVPVQSAKVLLIPFNHGSHVIYLTKLGKALVDNGHEVEVLVERRYGSMIEKSGTRPLLFDITKEADFTIALEQFMSQNAAGTVTGEYIVSTLPTHEEYCHQALGNHPLMEYIRHRQYDLVVIDGIIVMLCMYMIPYKYDIPFITLHGFQVASWEAGVTGLPSIEPELVTQYTNKMSFWERLHNMHAWLATYNNVASEVFSESIMKKYAGEKPKVTLAEVMRQSEMFLVNFEVMCLDYPRVSAPNYQYLGVSSGHVPDPLSADLQRFVDSAEHGIVVVSLGSMKAFHYVWLTIGEKVLDALGRLEQKALIQFNIEKLPERTPPNVLLLKWLPQNDLLGNAKTKLFVTHGGNNGQNEAAYHGVPTLVIPIAVDQPYAGVRAEHRGYGLYVSDRNTITSEQLHDMMVRIIHNESYSKNIKKCSAIIRSMPPASERFVFWVNHVLQFGGSHLRPPSLDMPLYQVLMLDIMAFYLGLGLLSLHLTIFVIYLCLRRFLGTSNRKMKES